MSINRLQRPRLVVVGNGMAGMRTVEELVARAPDRFDITVIGGEPHPSYNRILLSSVLAGERTLAEIVIQPSSWYEKHGIHLIAGNHAMRLTRLRGEGRSPMEPLFLRQIASGDRIEAAGAPNSELWLCRFARFPRYRRCRGNDRGREKSSPGSGDRWRPARARSGAGTKAAWRVGRACASDAYVDGAAARRMHRA
jgi:hypothetical protein